MALPPLDDNSRFSQACGVFRGKIRRIFSREHTRQEEFVDLELLLEIELSEVSKGSFLPETIVRVSTWVADLRPSRWVGDGGQRPSPQEGDEGTFFVQETIPGLLSLLHPNGWDRS